VNNGCFLQLPRLVYKSLLLLRVLAIVDSLLLLYSNRFIDPSIHLFRDSIGVSVRLSLSIYNIYYNIYIYGKRTHINSFSLVHRIKSEKEGFTISLRIVGINNGEHRRNKRFY
jgi:hypothetical protein